jgi:pimeloyl-ACP methyl ester carboxylesterase
MNYALYHPDKVESLALFGPMGLTELSGKSIMMLSIGSMYPMQFVRNWVTGWAIGDDAYVNEAYGEWFDAILYTMPSVMQPVPLTKDEKQKIEIPVILFLGTNDPIVGDAAYAAELAGDFPDIHIQTFSSGHIIAFEKADTINASLTQFLNLKSR